MQQLVFPDPILPRMATQVSRPPLGDDEPLGIFGWLLFPGIVNFADDEEKIVPFPRVGKEGQSAGSDSLLCLERKNVQTGEHNEIANVRRREQK
jgi:hypothetical protein